MRLVCYTAIIFIGTGGLSYEKLDAAQLHALYTAAILTIWSVSPLIVATVTPKPIRRPERRMTRESRESGSGILAALNYFYILPLPSAMFMPLIW